MAGHSKWSNIKHRKAGQDAKRAKVFTKIIRELTVAARDGGGNPDDNPALRTVVDKAKAEFLERRGADFEYIPLLGDRSPALDYRR